MITNISRKLLMGLAVLAAVMIPCLAMAQSDPGCGPDCPIDGGLSALIAAGVGYGVKKYREGRKKAVDN